MIHIVIIAILILATNSLHLKGHNAVSDSFVELTNMEDQIMNHINHLKQNKKQNDKQLPQTKGVVKNSIIASLSAKTINIITVYHQIVDCKLESNCICLPSYKGIRQICVINIQSKYQCSILRFKRNSTKVRFLKG